MDFLWHLWQQKSKNSCDAGAYTRARRWFFRKVCTLKKQNWEKGKNDWETVGNEWQNLLASMQVSVKKTDVSFYWKQRVVLLKTTCRFVENNVSFCWKQRIVLLKTTCCLNRERRERVANIPRPLRKKCRGIGSTEMKEWSIWPRQRKSVFLHCIKAP